MTRTLTPSKRSPNEFPSAEIAQHENALSKALHTTGHKSAEEESRTIEVSLRAFVDEAPVPIAMFDNEMRYVAASRRWLDCLCGGESNVIGRSHYDLAPEIPQQWKEMHRRALAGETLGNGAMRPWRDDKGAIGGLIIFAEDVAAATETERALRESNARLAAENKAMAGFYEASLKLWKSTSMNEGAEEMLSAAIDMLGADMGNAQLLDAEDKVLRIVAHRGFNDDFLEHFREVSAEHDTACGRALRTDKPVVIEDVELDVSFAAFRSVRRAAGYRAVVSAPLVNSLGTLLGMLSVHFRSPHRPSDSELQRLDLYRRRAADFIEHFAARQELRESEERLRLAVTASHMGMFDWDLRTGIFLWSDECYRMLGYQVGEIEPSQSAWSARIHPDDREAAEAAEARAKLERTEFISEYRIVRRDGSIRWVLAQGRFLYHVDKPVRLIGLKQDITESRQLVETQRMLVGELQHRTRNLMAVVQSIAHQTLNTVESLEDFEARFDQRLAALSRVQSLLSHADKEPITLREVVLMELEALGSHAVGDRITFGGAEAPLRKSAVEMLTLAIHELLTNAIKYGALASETGLLSVTWRIEDQRIVLEWIERGISSPQTADGSRRGYGRTLIEEALPYSLSAETKFDLGSDALRCLISLPFATKSEVDEMPR